MARLTHEVKVYIVQRLAMYDTPTIIAVGVKEQFGVEITRQQAETYDATRAGEKPATKWIKLFEATREKFKEAIDDIPIANKAMRLRRLNRMADRAEEKGNFPLAAALLKQAAEDAGDAYTNRRELTGKGGTALVPARTLDDLSDEELRARAAALMGAST